MQSTGPGVVNVQLGDIVFEVALFCTTTSAATKSQQGSVYSITSPATDVEGGGTQRGTAALLTSFSYPVSRGRPELVKEISALSGNPEALVFCVGPDSLVSKTREVCSDLNVEFRGENAEL